MTLEQGLYWDPDRNGWISTHSMMKTFRRCPKQTQYKYAERLKPRREGRPLREGTWMHSLLETKYKGGDWRETHAALSNKFNDLFDDEKDEIGNLPVDCARLMRSYEWHYKNDNWKIHEVEFMLETEFPDGSVYRGRVDLLVEDQFGLWIVDHKFNAKLPGLMFRLLDAQSALYVWAARRMGIPVQGHIWNYVRRKVPTIPQLLKDGKRLSSRTIDTDYLTYATAIKKYGLDPTPYAEKLAYLKSLRFVHGEAQRSSYFRRDVLERQPEMLRQVAREAYHTSKRMNAYDFSKPDFVERVVDRSCEWMCSYTELCALELFGADPRSIRRQRYTETDPMYYYYDDPFEATVGKGD